MRNSNENTTLKGSGYRVRILSCIVVVEILVLALFNLWPAQEQDKTFQDVVFSEDDVMMEEVVITKQQESPPPPPKPQVPVPVPNDEIIEEDVVELDNLNLSDYSDSLSTRMMGARGNSDQAMSNPQTGPSVVRIVEPTVPEAAKQAKVKAEIWVNFLVNKEGQVEEANISEIRLYDDETDSYRVVNTIDYGITEATIKAALQWKFRPAKNNGQIVKAYTKHIFTYGF